MRGVGVAVTILVLLASDVWLVHSKTRKEAGFKRQDRTSTLTRQTHDLRSHRRARQTDTNETDTSEKHETRCSYRTALLDFPPYVMNNSAANKKGFMYEKIEWFVETTCFMRIAEDPVPCVMEPVFVQTSAEMIKLIKERSVDFAFPIQAEDKEKLKDDPKVSLIRAFVSSGCSLIVNTKTCEEESREQLLSSITSQWPILACIILLSGISGVVIWLLEFRGNKTQFSPSFTLGSHEGFWWAVVSLTTVGYGDKTPKSFLGRMFGVVWILVGAIMLSLFTALFTNAMQAALDGTTCKDIDGKRVGVSIRNSEAQRVAVDHSARVVEFRTLEEMQKNFSDGAIGRVLVDRNTAFHFLDNYGLKRNRKIRMIRNIDFPLDYYLVHVNRSKKNSSDLGDPDDEKEMLAHCGPDLKAFSADLVGILKETVQEQVLTVQLQTADLSDEMEGLFSTGSQMTSFMLFCLLGILLALIVIGILWELYTKCSSRAKKKGLSSLRLSDKRSIPLNGRMTMMQNFADVEERLKELSSDIQKMKEEFANSMAGQENGLASQHNQWLKEEQKPRKSSMFSLLNGKSKEDKTTML